MKNKDDKILVSSVYIFYNIDKQKLIATKIVNYPGVPFACTPEYKSISERYSFQMYKTNNLYYIISNGGKELTTKQTDAISKIRNKVVGEDTISRIENESTATLTREEILSLVEELNEDISKEFLQSIKTLKDNEI